MNSRARGLLRFPGKLQQKFCRNCRLGPFGVLLFVLQLVLSRFHVNVVVVVSCHCCCHCRGCRLWFSCHCRRHCRRCRCRCRRHCRRRRRRCRRRKFVLVAIFKFLLSPSCFRFDFALVRLSLDG